MNYDNLQPILLKFAQTIGTKIYKKSQELVPVKSGQLKASGSFSYTSSGVTVRYETPYAARINGTDSTMTDNPDYTYIVREHQRRVPRGIANVKEHTKRMGVRSVRQTDRVGFLTKAKDMVIGDAKLLEEAWREAHGDAPVIKLPAIE